MQYKKYKGGIKCIRKDFEIILRASQPIFGCKFIVLLQPNITHIANMKCEGKREKRIVVILNMSYGRNFHKRKKTCVKACEVIAINRDLKSKL